MSSPGSGTVLSLNGRPVAGPDSALYRLDNLKTEVADYLTELNLVTTEDAGLLLAMPGHKADLLRNVNLRSGIAVELSSTY